MHSASCLGLRAWCYVYRCSSSCKTAANADMTWCIIAHHAIFARLRINHGAGIASVQLTRFGVAWRIV